MIASLVCVVLAGPLQATASSVAERSRSGSEERALEAAIGRGVSWLLARQSEEGAFPPCVRQDACPVALTAISLWALAENAPAAEAARLENSLRFLLGEKHFDGGIYAPDHGLRSFTSGIAGQALRSWNALRPTPALEPVLAGLDGFLEHRPSPESIAIAEGVDASEAASRASALLTASATLPPAHDRALRFLSKLEATGEPSSIRRPPRPRLPTSAATAPFTYDDLLPLVYRALSADDELVQRAFQAIQREYTLARNPDLTDRYGQGFLRGTEGLYYYYLVLARTLSTQGKATVSLADGQQRDWRRDLSRRLIVLQRDDGSWANEDSAWWEDEPVLVTSYALLCLRRCRDSDVGTAPTGN